MGSILICMPKPDDANRIAAIINRSGLSIETEILSTGAEILRVANERDYGVIITTKRQKDMSVIELAEYMPAFYKLIVLTSDPMIDITPDRGVKLLMPFKSSDLISAVEDIMNGFYKRRKKAADKKPRPRSAEDQKLIDDAKALLMEQNGLTEPEAFRYLQKNSMDYSRSLVETAQMILVLHG